LDARLLANAAVPLPRAACRLPAKRERLDRQGRQRGDVAVVAGLGFAVALFLGFAAGIVPALGAYRARITDALRTV
jgi:hypothetical protein